MIKRIFTVLLSLWLCIAWLAMPASALTSENLPAATDAAGIISDDAQDNDVSVNTYSNYIAACSEAVPAKEQATVSLGATVSDKTVVFEIQIPADGLYTIGMSYRATGTETAELELGLCIDGAAPFAEAEKLLFPRMWQDAEELRVDGQGNEFAAQQIPCDDFYYNLALDVTRWTAEPYLVSLSAGVHTVAITPIAGSFELESFTFGAPEQLSTYQVPDGDSVQYTGEPIVIEGEKTHAKSSYWLAAKTDNFDPTVTPNSITKSLVNYIGGGNWKTSGETIIWETPELPEGYYQLGFSYRQGAVIGGKIYRNLTIDGKTPFQEAQTVAFPYSSDWQSGFFADESDKPYLIYLSAGTHEIALTAVPGAMTEVRDLLRDAVSDLSDLYIDITMITGETADVYRDYDLFAQIPNMKERLEEISSLLQDADKKLQEITGESSGSYSSVIRNMVQVVGQMLDNRYTAHRYKSEYYTRYTAVASTLYEMRDMPLDIDKLVLTAPSYETPFENIGYFSRLWFSVQKFFVSFVNDYNSISGVADSAEQLTIWVNWGRDQAQVLNALTQTLFTQKTGIPVNIQLVNASIVQAVLSGKGPDCILQQSRSEPVNLAMRGVLYNLSEFDDVNDVLERFQDGAETPYYYKGGLYALPDTQVFYLMYYRKDILEQLGLSVPETWDEFREVSKLLIRRKLTVWMPNNAATSAGQADAGIGSINLFPSFLLQKGLQIYQDDGRSTNLDDSAVMETFTEWTDYYRKLKLPKTMDFYNWFRTGTCPIGISNYTLYTTLKAAAPEIDGLWDVAPIPGTPSADGTISHISSGGGTACSILKLTKNASGAWKFLKWWTDAQTQLTYSNEVEAILGPAGRVAVANVEAFSQMAWDAEMIGSITEAWNQVQEIPEYPGSYYVARSVYQSFWNVVEANENPKDMLLKYGKEADVEIERKWRQYENRN